MSKQRENVDTSLVFIGLVLITNNIHRTMFVTISKLTRFSFKLGFLLHINITNRALFKLNILLCNLHVPHYLFHMAIVR